MTISQQIAERVRQRVKQSSLRGVARELGVDKATLHRWLSGQRSGVNVKTLDKIAASLGLEVAEKNKISAA